MIKLSDTFLARPIAHRALHAKASGIIENSLRAVRAATSSNYAIEIDVQLSRDGVAMVFHDYALERLTGETGPVAQRTAQELGAIALTGSDDTIPTLSQVLDEVGGRTPLLIEIKDQDGVLGPNVGPLEEAVASVLEGYGGEVALMSFNPHSVAKCLRVAPNRARGLTTCAFTAADWPTIPEARRKELARIPDYDDVQAGFVSHDARDLAHPRLAEIKAAGGALLCWTVRSEAQDAQVREVVDNVTFEGYRPPFDA